MGKNRAVEGCEFGPFEYGEIPRKPKKKVPINDDDYSDIRDTDKNLRLKI